MLLPRIAGQSQIVGRRGATVLLGDDVIDFVRKLDELLRYLAVLTTGRG